MREFKDDPSRSDDYVSWWDGEHIIAEAAAFFFMFGIIVLAWLLR